jgi:hypothetical protein
MMAGATQHRQPAAAALAPASYTPTQDDLDEMHKVRAVHDVLDLFPDLALEVRLALLDRVDAELRAIRGGEAAHA